MANYRKIWENANGPIPKDELGRSFDIHHIDGNRSNNDISNLVALSMKDHMDLHIKQKDYAAANLIAHRMGIVLYNGYKRPDHSKFMKDNPDKCGFKKQEEHPFFGKKRPEHSQLLKDNPNKCGLNYERTEKHIQRLKDITTGMVTCKDNNGNTLKVTKKEYDSRVDLVGVTSNVCQPKLRKKIRCIEDDIIFNSIKDAAAYYNLGNSCIVKSLKSNVYIGEKKLLRKIKFEYL